jgi:hypothetical protein
MNVPIQNVGIYATSAIGPHDSKSPVQLGTELPSLSSKWKDFMERSEVSTEETHD